MTQRIKGRLIYCRRPLRGMEPEKGAEKDAATRDEGRVRAGMSRRCARCGHGGATGGSYGHRYGKDQPCASKVPAGTWYEAGRVAGVDRIGQQWEARQRCPCQAFVPFEEDEP